MLTNQGLRVCSIGDKCFRKNEHIDGTTDRTGLPLLNSLGLIKNSSVFVGNDSGLYHMSNLLEVPNIAIFTATSTEKNYDKRFHKYTKLIYRQDLKCRPCQHERRWNKDCKNWECRNISPEIIFEEIQKAIELKYF